MNVAPGNTYEAVLESGVTGLAGTLKLGLIDNAGAWTSVLSAADIIETPAGSGIYAASRVAPAVAGQYTLVWSLDGTTDPDQVATEDLLVTSSTTVAAAPAGSDLCALADVYRYAPGFDPDNAENATTVDQLANLITGQSVDIIETTNREFTAIAGLNPRSFDVRPWHIRLRRLPIGFAASISTISQYRNGTLVNAIAAADVIEEPRNRQAWQPITDLHFPTLSNSPVLLQEEDVFVVDATWGYPSIPADIREACAKLVIVRYLTDTAAAGTAFSDSISEDINVGGILKSAREVVVRYSIP